MLLNAKYRDERITSHHSPKESIIQDDLFIRKMAGSDHIISKLLIHKNIRSIYELTGYLADLNNQIIFLKNLNKVIKIILLGGFMCTMGYCVYKYHVEYLGRIAIFQKTMFVTHKQDKGNHAAIVKVEHKTPDFNQRSIFVPVRSVPQDVSDYSQAKITEWIQTYKIVGIVVDSQTKAIVENIKLQETIFVSIGDKIGEAVIVRILSDRVVCQLDGHEVELVP